MLQTGLTMYSKTYLSMRSIPLKRWQNVLNSALKYGKYENLHEWAKLVLIKYSKDSSMISQVGVQKFTPHNHIECTNRKLFIGQQKLEKESYYLSESTHWSTGQNADFSHHSYIFHLSSWFLKATSKHCSSHYVILEINNK